MTTLTNEQITAGAAVLGDNGQPIGRNAAIAVFDAMRAAAPGDELLTAAQGARRMLDIVANCASHDCEDCREYAGIHRDRIDAAMAALPAITPCVKSDTLIAVTERLPHKATMVLATDGDNYALAYQRYDLGATAWYDATDTSDNDVRLDFAPTHWAEVPILTGSAA